MPRSKLNTEPVAWEYHAASVLLRAADARKELAHRNAVKAGVLPDHKKDPRPAGTHEVIHDGDVVRIDLAVTTPATRLDTVPLWAAIEKAGIKRAALDKLIAKHTLTNAAPHKFTSSLVTV
jgi:hypothetical protein